MKTARRILLVSAAGLFLSALGLDAATYLPLSDKDLARRSPVIVRATVLGSSQRMDNVNGQTLPFTITTLQPIETLKGKVGDGTIQVRLPGGGTGDSRWVIPGTPVLQKGHEVVVFLRPREGYPGEYHLSEFGLGHYDILTDQTGHRFAVRPAFDPIEDLYLSILGPEPGAVSPERSGLRRDAESLIAMARSALDTKPADVGVAKPSGDLKTPLTMLTEWVNLGGIENGSNQLVRWFWDTGASANAVVANNGTQTLLSDASNGLPHLQNAIDQWHGGVPSSDIRISGITAGGNVTVFLDATSSFDGSTWNTPLTCPANGVIGLGGPGGPFQGFFPFKGDSHYIAPGSGSVSMRKVDPGAPGCTYSASVFRTAVMHELGHVLGLGHPDPPPVQDPPLPPNPPSNHSTTTSTDWDHAVMRSGVISPFPSTPQVDDTQAMQYYYGTAGPVPTAAFSISPNPANVGQTVTFTDASTGVPPITSRAWNFGDPSSGGNNTSALTSPTHSFASAGNYTVSLTATNSNGPNTVTHQVVVNGPPTAGFNFSPGSPTTGVSVSFTDTSTGSPAPTAWSWTFDDLSSGGLNTSASQNPTHTFNTAGTYNVSHTATNTVGTSAPILHTVTVVNPSPPTANFNFSPFSPVTNQNVFFTDLSTGSPAPTSWSWTFGDSGTSIQQHPSHAYTTTGTFTVTLIATNTAGDSAPFQQQITVSTPGTAPTAAFTFSPASPQPGQSVNFTDTSTGGPTSWFWSFGDSFSSSSPNPSHSYSSAGTYTVTLTASNNFGSTQASHNVTVSTQSLPVVSFGFSPGNPEPGQVVTFTDTSSGPPTSWAWDFGDGGTSTVRNPSHTYIGAGTFNVTLTATNAAASSHASQPIIVHIPTPCPSDSGTLPANAGHNFCITLSARDPRTGNTGPGLAIPQNALFGYFSIPALTQNPVNPEVFVKVLDGRVVNGFFWVFYGGLTDLEYTITVLDFQTGLTRQYLKPAFSTEGGFDTSAFAGGSAVVDPPPGASATGSTSSPGATSPTRESVTAGCGGDVNTLCLNSSHGFFVSLAARDQRTGRTGPGQAIPQNDIFGYFSIPALTSNPDNPEVFVKVLDGRVVNGHYWVFYSGLTDLEYTITVREIATGLVKTYLKPAGSAAGGFDTSAF